MRRVSHVKGLITLALTMLALGAPASAQDTPGVEVSGGYSFLRVADDELGDEKNFSKGWYADVAGNVTPVLAVVGQVFGTYKTFDEDGASVDLSVHGSLGGVRLSNRTNPRIVPFAEILAGAARSKFEAAGFDESESDGLLELGGGVNLMANTNVGIRLTADYIRVFAEDEGTNVFRIGAGVVFGFGAR